MVKEFFADYFLHTSDVTFDLANNKMEVHNNYSEPWKVTLVDTGLNTMTGGRVKRIQPYIGNETFMLTYGDGVSTVDLDKLVQFHRSHGRTATITTVNIGQMKGVLAVSYTHLCKLVVVPLRYGAGVKGKVVEAIYHGAPIAVSYTHLDVYKRQAPDDPGKGEAYSPVWKTAVPCRSSGCSRVWTLSRWKLPGGPENRSGPAKQT